MLLRSCHPDPATHLLHSIFNNRGQAHIVAGDTGCYCLSDRPCHHTSKQTRLLNLERCLSGFLGSPPAHPALLHPATPRPLRPLVPAFPLLSMTHPLGQTTPPKRPSLARCPLRLSYCVLRPPRHLAASCLLQTLHKKRPAGLERRQTQATYALRYASRQTPSEHVDAGPLRRLCPDPTMTRGPLLVFGGSGAQV